MAESIASKPSLSEAVHSNDSELWIASLLDRYASVLEAGDDQEAEQFLDEHPELLMQAAGHVESLRLLCRVPKQPERTGQRKRGPEDKPTEQTFSTLGDYQIHREIGRGGMGIVYEATQLSLRRVVAVKVLPFAAVLDQRQIKRFQNEAHAAASLHHPHIVPVYGVGCERGVHYYSMQLINGQSLEQTQACFRSELWEQRLAKMREENANQSKGNTTTRLAIRREYEDGFHREVSQPEFTIPFPQVERSEIRDAVEPDVQRKKPPRRLEEDSTEIQFPGNNSTFSSKSDRHFIRDTVELIICVAEALDYAHGEGVVHRDIKPSNLLIDQQGKIWIADFGLARSRGVGNLTAEGTLLGTIRYMSPEQIAARPCEVDHRTDIYSLGITLYELLTSRPAFQGRNREQLMRAVESELPVSPRRFNPSVTQDLETIVLKSIAKEKSERYDSAGELAEDLRRFLDGRPTLAQRPTAVDRAFKWVMRRRALVLSSLVVVSVMMLGLFVATISITWHSRQTEMANDRARFHLQQAHSVVDRFGSLMADGLIGAPATQSLRRDLLREAESYYLDFIRYAETDKRLQRELATVRFRLGAVLVDLGENELASIEYEQATKDFLALCEASPDDLDLIAELAMCFHNTAMLRKDQGKFVQAVRGYHQAIGYQEEALEFGPQDPNVISQWSATQTNLASLLMEMGKEQEAAGKLSQVLLRLDRVLARQPAHLAAWRQRIESRNTLVALLMHEDVELAESLLRRSILELETKRTPTDGVRRQGDLTSLSFVCQRAIAKSNLATLLGNTQRFEEAVSYTLTAIKELEEAMVRFPADTTIMQQLAIATNNHGQLEFSRGNMAAAKASFHQAEALFRRVVSNHPSLAEPKSRLAGVLHNQSMLENADGEKEAALCSLDEAIQLQRLAIQESPYSRDYRQYLSVHCEWKDVLTERAAQSDEPHLEESDLEKHGEFPDRKSTAMIEAPTELSNGRNKGR